MALFAPIAHTEHEHLLAWVEHGLVNARSTVHGLTDDQLWARPVPSSDLTLRWLLLHIGEVAEHWLGRAAAGPAGYRTDESVAEQWERSWSVNEVADDATMDSVLAEFDRRCAAGLDALRGTDLDAVVPLPTDMPWYPPDLGDLTARWVVEHVLGEIQRHSGHADILREAIDGRTMYDLIAEDQDIDMSYIGEWFAAHPEIPQPEW
jgi:hypothetical protein